MSIPDPIADIRAALLADDTVSDLCGDRVFHSEIPETESGQMPRAAIIVAGAGGPGRPKTLKVRRLRIDTICYGASLYESGQLHAAAREVLETLARRSSSVISVEMATDAQNARDPIKRWPVCFASYSVLCATAV